MTGKDDGGRLGWMERSMQDYLDIEIEKHRD